MVRSGFGTGLSFKTIFIIALVCLMILFNLNLWSQVDQDKQNNKDQSIENTPNVTESSSKDKKDSKSGDMTEPGVGVNGLPDSDSISFIKSLMALCFVLGLIFFAAYFFKKFTGGHTSGLRSNRVAINLVGHLPLGEKKFLSIVEIKGHHYFIGITPASINLLSELDLELAVEEPKANTENGEFENIFKKAKMLLQQRPGKS